jgi:Capsule assembly protein Wzi
VRSWIVAGLIAGVTAAGRAQVASSGMVAESPVAQQNLLKVEAAGVNLGSATSSAPVQVWSTNPKPTLWSENRESEIGMPAAESPAPSQQSEPRSNASEWKVERPRVSDPNGERVDSARTAYKGSNDVPLDSWIYDALDRLAAMGYLPTSTAIVRPWTRLECARLLAEAHDRIGDEPDATTASLLAALDVELAHETNIIDGVASNLGVQGESVYERFTDIAGTPLRDGFNFGQTLVDDFGRPYGKGGNNITGLSGRAEAGPFSVYIRGEYQYASAMPAYSAQAQQQIAAYDGLPFGWNLRAGTTNRVRTIEAYAALNLRNWQLSFGQQALWWGPDRSTSLILSNNSEAMPMLRLDRVKPVKMPGILGLLGPVHLDAFLAREGGIHYLELGPTFTPFGNANQAVNPAPFLWAVAATIKPTENFELGLGHTTIFAGYGRPLNFTTFIHSLSTTGNAQAIDPGKRVTEINLSYHLPGLRKKAVVYAEGMAWDDPLQGKFVARYAWDPGLYLPQLPKFKKLDLRLEAAYTNLPKLANQGYFYSNAHYPQGYTNYGQIIGSWVGRQGIGGQASSTYWFSARNKATVSYRGVTADPSVLGGGNQKIVSANYTWLLRPDVELTAMGQYEHWNFPTIGGPKSDFTSSFQIKFFPKERAGAK